MKKINSRTKGHGFERDVCKLINKKFNIENPKYIFKRVPMSGGFDKKNFPGDIFSTDPSNIIATEFSVECKFHKKWKLEDLINGSLTDMNKWWLQAQNDASEGDKCPILLFKKNNSKIYYMMKHKDIIERLPDGDWYPVFKLYANPPYPDREIGLFDNLLNRLVENN